MRPQFASYLCIGKHRPDLVVRFGRGTKLPLPCGAPCRLCWSDSKKFVSDHQIGNLFFRSCKAGIAYFSLAFGAGFVLGALRVPFLVPRLGERVAELIEMPFMFIVIVLAARFITIRFDLPATVLVRLSTGLLDLGLLIAAELLLAVAFQYQSLGQYVSSRNPVSGTVYLAMLLLFAAMIAIRSGPSVRLTHHPSDAA